MNEDVLHIDCTKLDTEEGAGLAAVQLAQAFCDAALWPVLNHTPQQMRQVVFEKIFCALAGAACADIGPALAKESLGAAKLAIDDAVASRAARH